MNREIPSMQSIEAEVILARAEAARIKGDVGKTIIAAVFRGLAPAICFGLAVAGTTIVLNMAEHEHKVILVCCIWICATIAASATALAGGWERRPRQWPARPPELMELKPGEAERLGSAIQE